MKLAKKRALIARIEQEQGIKLDENSILISKLSDFTNTNVN